MTYTEWVRERQCGSKLAWARKRDARQAATHAAANYREQRSDWNAYLCPTCNLYHIGHNGDPT